MDKAENGASSPKVPEHTGAAFVPASSIPRPWVREGPPSFEQFLSVEFDNNHEHADGSSYGNSTAHGQGHSGKDVDPRIWLHRVLHAERTAMNTAMHHRHMRLLEHFEVVMSHYNGNIAGNGAHREAEPNLNPAAVEEPSTRFVSEPCNEGEDDNEVPEDGVGESQPGATQLANKIESEGRKLSIATQDIAKNGARKPALQRLMSSTQRLKGETWEETFRNLATSTVFEFFFGLLIIGNAILMGMERQYRGMETAFIISYRNTTSSASNEWPGAEQTFDIAEIIFGIIFTLEVLFKLIALRQQFFKSAWNLFDTLVVAMWLIDRDRVGLPMSPLLLRLARIGRLLRLLRVVRWIAIFDPLHLIVKAVFSSVSILFWAIIVLVLCMIAVAMVTSQGVEDFIRDTDNDLEARVAVFESWGTFTRSMVTMFEISLANWVPQCRLLMDEVSESWALFFLAYKCSIGFAVVQVITAVFIQQTFKVAARDEEVMISEKKAAANAMFRNLGNLFQALDVSGDGSLTAEEFEEVLQDKRVQTWFHAIEVDASDITELFQLLDDGDGMISREEFIKGVKSIKGTARASDMLVLMNRIRSLNKHVGQVDTKIERMKKQLFPTRHDGTVITP